MSSLFYSEHQNACFALRTTAHTVAVRALFFVQTRWWARARQNHARMPAASGHGRGCEEARAHTPGFV